MKITLAVGTMLLGCGIFGLLSVGMAEGGPNKLMRTLHDTAPSRGLPMSSAAGAAMFVSGAIVIFSGRNRIS